MKWHAPLRAAAVMLPLMILMTGLGTTEAVTPPGALKQQQAMQGRAVPYRDGVLVRVEEHADGRRENIALPETVQPRHFEDVSPQIRPRLVRTSHRAAAVAGAGKALWWLDGEWKRRELPQLPAFHQEIGPGRSAPDHYYLDGSTLYAGRHSGEWGGLLASLDVGREGAEWICLNARKTGDASGITGIVGVADMLRDKAGSLWVATDSTHMGLYARGIFQREETGRWKAWMDGEGDRDEGPWRCVEPDSPIGLALDARGSLHVLMWSGVYVRRDETLERVLEMDARKMSLREPTHGVVCCPSSLGISRTGDFYVPTNAYGILACRKVHGKWTARQIMTGKSTVPPLPDDKLPPARGGNGGQ